MPRPIRLPKGVSESELREAVGEALEDLGSTAPPGEIDDYLRSERREVFIALAADRSVEARLAMYERIRIALFPTLKEWKRQKTGSRKGKWFESGTRIGFRQGETEGWKKGAATVHNAWSSRSIPELIQASVEGDLARTIHEASSAPNRDDVVVDLPSGRCLPLETEIRVQENPPWVETYLGLVDDPLRPNAPVGPWVTSRRGKVLWAVLSSGLAAGIGGLALAPSSFPAFLLVSFVAFVSLLWLQGVWRSRRRFERTHPILSVTYWRPKDRPHGPYFVWEVTQPADPDDPTSAAKPDDTKAVGVELTFRGQGHSQPPQSTANHGPAPA